MIKNRESAARSRARKQAYTMELEAEVQKLKELNAELQKKQEEMMEMQKNQVVFLGQTSISYLPFHPALNGCIPVVFQLVNARVFFFCSSNRKTEGN